MDASLFTSMLFATVVAGTPLIIVALGLLVNEKAGVLNLGAEGMMTMGAVAAFAVTHESGNPWLGVAAGMGAGVHLFGPSISQNDAYVTPRPDDRLLVATLRQGQPAPATLLPRSRSSSPSRSAMVT